MFITIPATRWTRQIELASGENVDGRYAFSITTIDKGPKGKRGLFLALLTFRPWHWPGIVLYNGVEPLSSIKPTIIKAKRMF